MPTVTRWDGLYFHSQNSEEIAAGLYQCFEQAGYQRYDPFPGGTGTPPGLSQFVRLFVAPAQSDWVHVLGSPELDLIPALSQYGAMLHAWLSDAESGIALYRDGQPDSEGIATFLQDGKTLADLERIRQGNIPVIVERSSANSHESLLPDDVRQLAQDHHVNPDQAGKLINRLSSQMFGKLDRSSGGEAGSMHSQAQALVTGGAQVNWNSPTAQRLKAMMNLLTVPDNWREPLFEEVLEAYQVARRLAKTPSARLMPDEQAAYKAVPGAISFIPVYVGK